jgi:RimJ/RimL family protein N-acetyltransferase
MTILAEGRIAGNVVCFTHSGKREVGYWIGKKFWGKGVATAALRRFLALVTERPLYAGVAKDNAGSIRVPEKCGFTVGGEARGFSKVRGEEVEELVMILHGNAGAHRSD